MFIYGSYWRTLYLKLFDAEEVCPECGNREKLYLHISCKVYHLMFIPTWAGTKMCEVICPSCKGKYSIDLLPTPSQTIAQSVLKKTTYRWWYFTGTVMIILFIALIIKATTSDNEVLKSAVENVHDGQTISYKLPNGKSTCLYIDSICGDTLYVRKNKLETKFSTRSGNLSYLSINSAENYDTIQTIITKEDIWKMYQSDSLLGVDFTPMFFEINKDISFEEFEAAGYKNRNRSNKITNSPN